MAPAVFKTVVPLNGGGWVRLPCTSAIFFHCWDSPIADLHLFCAMNNRACCSHFNMPGAAKKRASCRPGEADLYITVPKPKQVLIIRDRLQMYYNQSATRLYLQGYNGLPFLRADRNVCPTLRNDLEDRRKFSCGAVVGRVKRAHILPFLNQSRF